MRRHLALALTLVALAAPLARAQTSEEITVSLVEVPVYLEARGRASLNGLTRDSFELYVNGSRQKIDYFDAAEQSDDDGDLAPAVQRRRLIVLAFDTWGSSFNAIRRGKESAKKFVETARPGDTFAIATVGRDGVQFVVPFTNDRAAVARAVETLAPSNARDPFRIATTEKERAGMGTVTRPASGAAGDFGDLWRDTLASVSYAGAEGTLFVDRETGQQVMIVIPAASHERMFESAEAAEREGAEQDDRALIGQLGALADRLSNLSGTKHVVLLSELRPENVLGDSLRTQNIQHLNIQQVATRLHRRYQAAGVMLDTVDLAGLRAPWQVGDSVDVPSFGHLLSLGTGGTATHSLNTLQKTHRVAYVLGFKPSGPQKKNNVIKVAVPKAPFGTIVRYRTGYSLEEKIDPLKTDGLFLADVVMNDIPQHGITLDVDINKGERTEISVSIPGQELLARPAGVPLLLDVFVYVFDEKNMVAGWSYERLQLDIAKGRAFLETSPYTIPTGFYLQPGRFSARTLVRFAGSDLAGYKRSEFSITAQ